MPIIEPLKPGDRPTLEGFMSRPEHPDGTLSYRETQGFIFTVACAPVLVMPSEWLPRIFGEAEPVFESREEAGEIMGILMAIFNENATGASHGGARLPEDCAFREDLLANLEPDAPVAQWCRGFRLGHLWLEDSWDDVLPEELGDELAKILATLSFFSSRSMAEAFVEELSTSEGSLESLTAKFRDLFPNAVAGYARMGQALFKALMELEAEERGPVSAPVRPGRNDPCPCGSGRKYKKCCGANVH